MPIPTTSSRSSPGELQRDDLRERRAGNRRPRTRDGRSRRRELAGCLEELVEQGAEEEGDVDLDVGTVSGRDVPFPAVGEQTEAVELEVPFEVEGQSAAAYPAIVAIRQERAVGGIFMFSFPGPFPADEQERLAGVLADRLAP